MIYLKSREQSMRIFVAGATGAIGSPLVSHLVTEGHQVFGMTRYKERSHHILKLGAIPIIADALDASSVLEGVKKSQPEVIVEMLTSLPKEYTPQAMSAASALDKKIRTEGGAHLQKAALLMGVRRYIIQSSAFWYEPGIHLADETTPFAFNASPAIAAGTKVYMHNEQRVLHAENLEGVVLRLGFLYGPLTWYALDGNMANRVRDREYPIVGDGNGIWNFVHVEDVAKAIALALNCPPGIYNINDDTPVKMSSWLPAYARWLGAPLPLTRSIEEELALNGADSVYYATLLRGATNAKAKCTLGFIPRPLEWIET